MPLLLPTVLLALSAPLHAATSEPAPAKVVFRPTTEQIAAYARSARAALDSSEDKLYTVRLVERDGTLSDEALRRERAGDETSTRHGEYAARTPRGRLVLARAEALEFLIAIRNGRRVAQARLDSADKARAVLADAGLREDPGYRRAAAADKKAVSQVETLETLDGAEKQVLDALAEMDRRLASEGPAKAGRDAVRVR